MKKVGDLMKEMGFNQEASDSVKEAFVRHLIKAANKVEAEPRVIPAFAATTQNESTVENKNSLSETKAEVIPMQLSFDFLTDESRNLKRTS